MNNIQVTLPQDVWDRIVEILNYSDHPDASYCKRTITNQINYPNSPEKGTSLNG